MTSIFALVDGNNFYVSCERIFNPKLEGIPVVVCGNNDGIIVSRSAEAKALGIKMGFPAFKLRDLFQQHGVKALSSNYALYADMSRRMADVLASFSPRTEIYSIDESFIDLTGMKHIDLVEYGQRIRAIVRQWTGLPVCVGIGRTKTLAKLANFVAKKRIDFDGVCDFTDERMCEFFLPRIPVTEVWGVGPASAVTLANLGIKTVLDLRSMDPRKARQALTVVGERIIHELNSISCLDIETIAPARKGTAVTRNFSRAIVSFDEMREAVAAYATRAAEKLRDQRQVASSLTVFMHTNRFNGDPPYSNSQTVRFPGPTADALEFVSTAVWAAQQVWRDGYRYSKAGVITDGLVPAGTGQQSLLRPADPRRLRLMHAMDRVNARMGRGTLRPLGVGIKQSWRTKFSNRSPSYTTRWDELPVVRS
jgi:DNA polymerase V